MPTRPHNLLEPEHTQLKISEILAIQSVEAGFSCFTLSSLIAMMLEHCVKADMLKRAELNNKSAECPGAHVG